SPATAFITRAAKDCVDGRVGFISLSAWLCRSCYRSTSFWEGGHALRVNLEPDRVLRLRARPTDIQGRLPRILIRHLVRAVIALNFRLHIDVCCSIFTAPL